MTGSGDGDGVAAASTLEVDGEVFELRRSESGGTHYSWVSGSNPGYGFSSSATFESPEAHHRAGIQEFLSMIDPATGYIEDD